LSVFHRGYFGTPEAYFWHRGQFFVQKEEEEEEEKKNVFMSLGVCLLNKRILEEPLKDLEGYMRSLK
jgi:hypothetical protein